MELLISQASMIWTNIFNLSYWLLLWTSQRSCWRKTGSSLGRFSKAQNMACSTPSSNTFLGKFTSWSQTVAAKVVLSTFLLGSGTMAAKKEWIKFNSPLSNHYKPSIPNHPPYLTLSLVEIWVALIIIEFIL